MLRIFIPLIFLAVIIALAIGSIANPGILATPRSTPAPPTAAAEDTRSARARWFDENRVDVNELRILGFTMVSNQPGLVLLRHDSGACFLAPNVAAAYIQVNETVCTETHRRDTTRPTIDLYGSPIPR